MESFTPFISFALQPTKVVYVISNMCVSIIHM